MHVYIPKKKICLLTATVVLLSLLIAAPAFAEGETPVEEKPVEETAPTEEQPADIEPIHVEAAAPEVPDDTCEAAAGEDNLDPADPYYKVGTTTYQFLPDGGTCPAGTEGVTCFVSSPGGNPVQDAIDYVTTSGLPTDRKIYVEGGTYTGGAAFDATSDPLFGQLNGLIGVDGSAGTIINGDVTLDQNIGGFTLSGFTINGYVGVYDSTGTLILDDVDVTSSSTTGIYVSHHNGNIEVKNTTSSGNNQGGAYIDNGDPGNTFSVTLSNVYFDDNLGGNGLEIITGGKITINEISANRNSVDGIYVASDFSALSIKNATLVSNGGRGLYAATSKTGLISLDYVLIADNDGAPYGVYLATAGSTLIKNTNAIHNNSEFGIDATAGTGYVKIYDSMFNDTSSAGLDIIAKGPVYLSSIQARDNNGTGVYIDNCQESGGVCTGVGTVVITSPGSAGIFGANDFSSNGWNGLSVSSGKAITVSNVIADGNTAAGMDLQNHFGSGGITIKKTIRSNEFFSFNNSASGNKGGNGFIAWSTGAIRLEYLLANNNSNGGAYINNTPPLKASGVTVKYSEFNGNLGDRGIYILSKGSAAMTNVSASNNASDGARIRLSDSLAGSISINGTKGFTCFFNENSGAGLELFANNTIKLSNIEANENGQENYIYNADAPANKPVSITNASFNYTDGRGLYVGSKGSITLNKITANDNLDGGAYLENIAGLGTVNIKDSEFNHNSIGASFDGLAVHSFKNILLYNVSASDNGEDGVFLDNCQFDSGVCVGTGSVSIKSGKGIMNTFDNNGGYGVTIFSKGSISLSNMDASGNTESGLYINADDDATSGNVTITASSKMRNLFAFNGKSGLLIYTDGQVTLNYIDAIYNGEHGAYVENNDSLYTKAVKIKDSTFTANTDTGLDVTSNGQITLQGVDCSDNSHFNGTIWYGGEKIRDVLSSALGPDQWTFYATSTGYDITLTSDFFDGRLELRGPDGELIDAGDAGGSGTVTLSAGTGLVIDYYTIRVLSNDGMGGTYELDLNGGGSAGYDMYYGARLENRGGTAGIKILYSSKMGYGAKFNNNSYTGLYAWSNGAISVVRADALYNGYNGMRLMNQSDSEQPITVNTVTVEGSLTSGLAVDSDGNVTLINVNAFNNGIAGASIDNSSSVTPRTVKVSNSMFIENRADGNYNASLEIISAGAVTLSNVVSINSDADYGVYIDNHWGDGSGNGTGNVTVSGKENIFSGNYGYGILIHSNGEVSLTNFDASYNGGNGVEIRNHWFAPNGSSIKINNTNGKSFNTIENNGNLGLNIVSTDGAITLNKIFLLGNKGSVVFQADTIGDKKVSLTNSVIEDANTGHGIQFDVEGSVVVTNVRASGNAGSGIKVENYRAPDHNITVNNLTAFDNFSHGVYIASDGNLVVNRLTTYNNNAMGAALYTWGSVTLTNATSFGNTGDGFDIYAGEKVSLITATAASNGAYGFHIIGQPGTIPVSLNKVNAMWNTQNGIHMENVSEVVITLTNSIANGDPTQNADGLNIFGDGTTFVTLNKCTFMGNFGNGVELYNTNGTPTLISTLIFANDVDGLGDLNLYIHS